MSVFAVGAAVVMRSMEHTSRFVNGHPPGNCTQATIGFDTVSSRNTARSLQQIPDGRSLLGVLDASRSEDASRRIDPFYLTRSSETCFTFLADLSQT
jgi:hypothetical protein